MPCTTIALLHSSAPLPQNIYQSITPSQHHKPPRHNKPPQHHATRHHHSTIDFREFVTTVSVATKGCLTEKLLWAFSLYDLDDNHYLSRQEITQVLTVSGRCRRVVDCGRWVMAVDCGRWVMAVDCGRWVMAVDYRKRKSMIVAGWYKI